MPGIQGDEQMIIDEGSLGVLRSKYAIPPCPSTSKGLRCICDPKVFTFRACVWQGYKEARDAFPALAETIEKLWKAVHAADEFRASLNSYSQGCSVLAEEDVQRLDAVMTDTFNALKEPAQ
jgi:hypothetical protein